MKYEEWIQYEEKRLNQPNPHTWIALEPALLRPPKSGTFSPTPEDKPPAWALIVQVFNSRRI
ncbi:hypothetical protein KQH61_05755 [bacterium]|nr:hypothetical protein [bacterium]MCB2179408.1 hypothetical protein [bacterium]